MFPSPTVRSVGALRHPGDFLQEAQHLLLEGLIGEVLDHRVGQVLFTDNV